MLKKILGTVASLVVVANVQAQTFSFDNNSQEVTPSNLVADGSNFVQVIKDNKGSTYNNLKFVSVGNYAGTYTVSDDSNAEITQITITSLPVVISGVPLYPALYKPTLSLSATVTNHCQVVTPDVKLYKISGGVSLVNNLFIQDLDNWGTNLFTYLIANSGLKNHCGN